MCFRWDFSLIDIKLCFILFRIYVKVVFVKVVLFVKLGLLLKVIVVFVKKDIMEFSVI